MPSIGECLARAAELASVSDSPRLDAELLLAHCLGRDRTYLFTWPERPLTQEQEVAFASALERRRRGEPVAHILGYREFWSLPLEVNASTLIPRPDTECLVETALTLLPATPHKVLDLGTGTGAIALALASERPEWDITACERCPHAVALAARNRERLGLKNVQVVQSDWFSAIDTLDFDLVVSNPPYIDAADEHLRRGDLRFEPRSALVAADAGLADIRHIVEHTARHMQRACWLVLEHGWQQAEAVRRLFQAAGFEEVQTWRDLGGNERLTGGHRPISPNKQVTG